MGLIERKCQCCGKPMMVREADVKRGWGKFCSKSCKASKQEQRTGQYRQMLNSDFGNFDNTGHQDHGWDEPNPYWGRK